MSLCDLDSDAGENTCEQLGQTFGTDRVIFCHCDVTDYVQFEEAFQSTVAEFDGIDIVVNNAEIMNDKFWELEVDVNLVGVYVSWCWVKSNAISDCRMVPFGACYWHCSIWARIKKAMAELSSTLDQRKVCDHKSQRLSIVQASMRFWHCQNPVE